MLVPVRGSNSVVGKVAVYEIPGVFCWAVALPRRPGLRDQLECHDKVVGEVYQ